MTRTTPPRTGAPRNPGRSRHVERAGQGELAPGEHEVHDHTEGSSSRLVAAQGRGDLRRRGESGGRELQRSAEVRHSVDAVVVGEHATDADANAERDEPAALRSRVHRCEHAAAYVLAAFPCSIELNVTAPVEVPTTYSRARDCCMGRIARVHGPRDD